MKRKREMEKVSEIKSAIDELTVMAITMKPDDGDDGYDHDVDGHNCSDGHPAATIPTMPFLHVCTLVIQVLDKIGPTMAVLRQDITQNIQRLEGQCEADPSLCSNLVEILKKEATSLLQRLAKDPDQNMEQAVGESYNISLKPWHGWISSAAFKVS
ncbi:Glycolipid transfer protein 3 [Linum grandiflorum]